ncbi:sodium:solute symporter [Maribius pontilimi]|uniref:histidine kinase n=1 Tax=Palleronia pontilimi TaxID=1964209 RepID=A0A934IHA3_9RHOB|nr:sensor histidine kinase [Palleronia pontilimi]MBJ3762836.1 sodium:solute symporter [Palleronia pontilimi]
MTFNMLILGSLAYVALLFAVAFWAERRAMRGRAGWLRGPVIYTLSLSIYCTAWTFYGAVGSAARNGLEFVAIYSGPTLVLVGWWVLLRKLVRIGRAQRITSIADLISSRYGKSPFLGGLVTLLAVVGITPYIALQLQSITLSFAAFSGRGPEDVNDIALLSAIGLAVFTIVFGTRNLDVNERHSGIVTAIALEALVKLVALLAVGAFVVWGVAGGPAATYAMIEASPIADWQMQPARWLGVTFLSAAAFLCLPRMFQVLVVENSDERHLATASWAFPLYLFAMSLFVVPIAVAGLTYLPAGSNPDLFVLTVPLSRGQDELAMLAFLGGFSSATSMVIVAAIALATMISNHIVVPLWLSLGRGQGATMSGDVRHLIIGARRAAIVGLLALGYVYFRTSGGGAFLASIGLISFCGIAQVVPALLGGIFWRGATRVGAGAGLTLGFAIWAWTLFLPSVGDGTVLGAQIMADGPFGVGWLRPQALFGIDGIDPLLHTLVWSMAFNTAAFLAGSLLSRASPLERVQGAAMVNVFRHAAGPRGASSAPVEAEDLLLMAQRILGAREAQRLFQSAASAQGKLGYLPDVTPDFVEMLERQLAGSVGAATAHAMVGQITGGAILSVEQLMRVADETAQIMEYSARLEAQSDELTRTARQLRDANDKLTRLSIQKDAFLSQISHELRTPMTSIRAFSEILRDGADMAPDQRARFSGVIHDEARRLTRLLDDLLDLGVLEAGQVSLRLDAVTLGDVIDRAVASAGELTRLEIRRDRARERVRIETDPDRLSQVFINLIGNAVKYCDADRPVLTIRVRPSGQGWDVDFSDNGSGVPRAQQDMIFEKFARAGDTDAAGGAGLGLAICREIMARLGGDIAYLPGQSGAAFRVHVPTRLGASSGKAAAE